MHTLRQLCATTALIFALSTPFMAGDMGTGKTPTPPPPTGTSTTCGDMGTGVASYDADNPETSLADDLAILLQSIVIWI